MELTLNINGEAAAILRQQAAATGRDVQALAEETLLERLIGETSEAEAATPSTRLTAFRDWLGDGHHGNPNADLSRGSVYGDR